MQKRLISDSESFDHNAPQSVAIGDAPPHSRHLFPKLRPHYMVTFGRCLRRFGPAWSCNPKPPAHGARSDRTNSHQAQTSQARRSQSKTNSGADFISAGFWFRARQFGPTSLPGARGSRRRGSDRAGRPCAFPEAAPRSRRHRAWRSRSSGFPAASRRPTTCRRYEIPTRH